MTAIMRLLIVDDEEAIRSMLTRHFRFLGYDVAEAGNGREALEVLETQQFSVVITDVMMPVMDGIALLTALRDDHPLVRAVVITGYISLDMALACLRQGAEAIIPKPLEDLDELVSAVAVAATTAQRWMDTLRRLRACGGHSSGARA